MSTPSMDHLFQTIPTPLSCTAPLVAETPPESLDGVRLHRVLSPWMGFDSIGYITESLGGVRLHRDLQSRGLHLLLW